jgi:hypothetical protein
MRYVVGFISDDGLLGRTFEVDTEDKIREVLTYMAADLKDDELTDEVIAQFDDKCNHATRFGIYFVGGLEDWNN